MGFGGDHKQTTCTTATGIHPWMIPHEHLTRGALGVLRDGWLRNFFYRGYRACTDDTRIHVYIYIYICVCAFSVYELLSMFPTQFNGHGFLIGDYIRGYTKLQEGPLCLQLRVS